MGKVTVHPKDWEEGGKSLLKENWYISYRFYDDNLNKKKQITIELNYADTLTERRKDVKDSIAEAIKLHTEYGYNPILDTKNAVKLSADPNTLTENTPLIAALEYVQNRLKHAPTTMKDIKQVIATVKKHAVDIPIGEVNRKFLKELLAKCAIKEDGTYSGDKYNRWRTYLGMLFSELLEYEVVQANIPLSLKRQKGAIKRIPTLLTPEQQQTISNYLKEKYLSFWLYLQCFFHSGARSAEMLRLKVGDLDFKNQRIKFLIKKGTHYREVYRPMADVSVKYWQAVVWGAPDDYYIFSRGKKPGPGPIQPFQITKSWNRHIITKLGINITFYKNKHLKMTLSLLAKSGPVLLV